MKKLSILALSATVAITPAYAEMISHYNHHRINTHHRIIYQTSGFIFCF